MQLDAIVKYKNGKAFYHIHKDSPGIYQATLDYFEGEQNSDPPDEITLIRGIRHWAGSYNDPMLLNDLGEIIEKHLTGVH